MVARHCHPIDAVAVDGVAPARLREEVFGHRVHAVTARVEHGVVVGVAEVLGPDRGVVHGAIRLRDAVVRVVRELARDRPDHAGALKIEFHELAGCDLVDVARSATLDLVLKGRRPQRGLLVSSGCESLSLPSRRPAIVSPSLETEATADVPAETTSATTAMSAIKRNVRLLMVPPSCRKTGQ